MAGFPQVLPEPLSLEVRGEVWIAKADFERLNAQRDEEGLSIYANPRNLAAGTVKLLSPKEVAKRPLRLMVHGLAYKGAGERFKTITNAYHALKSWGFPMQAAIYEAQTMDAVWDAIHSIDQKRHTLPYETDGAVIKLNDYALHPLAGSPLRLPVKYIARVLFLRAGSH